MHYEQKSIGEEALRMKKKPQGKGPDFCRVRLLEIPCTVSLKISFSYKKLNISIFHLTNKITFMIIIK
jgi:hypothetical protein